MSAWLTPSFLKNIYLYAPGLSCGVQALLCGMQDPVSCCWSVTQPCPTLCNPTDCSMPGCPLHYQLLELARTHVHWVGDALQLSSSVIPFVVPFFSCLQSFPASGSFPMSQFFASNGQADASASASVLPMNIQDWFPLGWTGLISLLSKGLSRVFSNTTVFLYN